MPCDEGCRTAVLGKTERTVGWEGNGCPVRSELVRHCIGGNPQSTDRLWLPPLNHSFTLDVNVYVQSRRAGERVMESLTRFVEGRVRLKVNRTKSAVDRPWKRKFLGYTVTTHFSPQTETGTRVAQARQGSDPPNHAGGTGTKHPQGDRRD